MRIATEQRASFEGFYHADRSASLTPIAAVEYLEAVLAFPSDHGLGMAITQLDLTNRSTGRINLAENYRRASRSASWRVAGARVAAVSNLDGCRLRVEARLEHCFLSITNPLFGRT
jgi:hypothetical protein